MVARPPRQAGKAFSWVAAPRADLGVGQDVDECDAGTCRAPVWYLLDTCWMAGSAGPARPWGPGRVAYSRGGRFTAPNVQHPSRAGWALLCGPAEGSHTHSHDTISPCQAAGSGCGGAVLPPKHSTRAWPRRLPGRGGWLWRARTGWRMWVISLPESPGRCQRRRRRFARVAPRGPTRRHSPSRGVAQGAATRRDAQNLPKRSDAARMEEHQAEPNRIPHAADPRSSGPDGLACCLRPG